MRRPLLCFCICLFVLISLWTKITHPLPRSAENAEWEGQYVSLKGQVYQKEYRICYGEEKLLLYLDSILILSGQEPSVYQTFNIPNKIICEVSLKELRQADQMPPLGCHIVLEGMLQSFLHATNEGEFDAANYYAIEGIDGRLEEGRISGMDCRYWPIREGLFRLRQHFLRNLYLAFPEKEASILAKMLLGDGSGLDKEIRDLYQSNGIVHILSISGLHITLLGMGFYQLLRRLTIPILPAALAGGVVILLYGIMTGFGVSACRAIGMYLIRMLGEIWGRTYDMLTAMGVLAVIMLLENPLLSYHSGFLLSFSSVCGVGLLVPVLTPPPHLLAIKPWDRKSKKCLKLLLERTVSGFVVSLSVTLFTLPIQLFFFYKIPVYSVLINLFVIPFMSVVMGIGISVMILPVLAFLSPIEVGIFNWFEWLCHVFEELPGHTLSVGRPAIWKILIYYGLIVIVVWWKKEHKCIVRVGGLVMALTLLLLHFPHDPQIYCLDVGQGDCFVVRTRENKCFLFDGGSSSRQDVGEKVIVPFLQYHGISKLDGVFLSHADTDHVNGVLQIIEKDLLDIKQIFLPDVQEEALLKLEKRLEELDGLQVQRVQKGDVWRMDEFTLDCLYPSIDVIGESNETSACYLLRIGGLSMLFTGDVEGEGEKYLVQELERRKIAKVDVLKVAHHGSANSTSKALLQQIKPRMAVISCGRKNPYGHPHTETLERLKEEGCIVWTTPKWGRITINAEKGTIEGYLKENMK